MNSSSEYIANDIIPFSTLIKRDHERYNSNQTARFRPSYIVANISASSLNPIYSGSELDTLPFHLRRRDYPPSSPGRQPYTSSSHPSHLLEAIPAFRPPPHSFRTTPSKLPQVMVGSQESISLETRTIVSSPCATIVPHGKQFHDNRLVGAHSLSAHFQRLADVETGSQDRVWWCTIEVRAVENRVWKGRSHDRSVNQSGDC